MTGKHNRRDFLRLGAGLGVGFVFGGSVSGCTQMSKTAKGTRSQLTAGVAAADITPEVGFRVEAAFFKIESTGIHDRLWAKALVLRQGDVEMAFVFCDLCGISPEVSSRTRRLVSKRSGIPESNIVITASHTHFGPQYFWERSRYFHKVEVAEHGFDRHDPAEYREKLVTVFVDIIAKAQASAKPVTIQADIAKEYDLSFNRRFYMKAGSQHLKRGIVRMSPPQDRADVVKPAGPIDPDIGILFFRDKENNKPIASMTNFACHTTALGGREFSADYPYYLEQSLQQSFGEGFVSMFSAGCSGDIDSHHAKVYRPSGEQHCRRIGNTLAEKVKEKVSVFDPIAKPDLAVDNGTIEAALREYSPEQVAEAYEKLPKTVVQQLDFLEQTEISTIIDLDYRNAETIELEVQVFRLSDEVAIVGLPGEVFVELGLDIKKASPFKRTIVMELCNQDAGWYIPTQRALDEGGYESVCTILARGSGERLVEEAIRQLKLLKKEARE
jgi:hypothetical protein